MIIIMWHGISTRGKCGLERANSWYEEKPEGVVESENLKILWDFTIQCDPKIEARRPDIVFIDKKKIEVVMIDVAIPGDDRMKEKELENIEKYQLLKYEIAKVWHMRKVIVVPVVTGALGVVSVHEANRRESEVGSYPVGKESPGTCGDLL